MLMVQRLDSYSQNAWIMPRGSLPESPLRMSHAALGLMEPWAFRKQKQPPGHPLLKSSPIQIHQQHSVSPSRPHQISNYLKMGLSVISSLSILCNSLQGSPWFCLVFLSLWLLLCIFFHWYKGSNLMGAHCIFLELFHMLLTFPMSCEVTVLTPI